MAMMKGEMVIEALLGASPGEQMLVNDEEWTSLDDLEFAVVTERGEGDSRFVTLDDEQDELDPDAYYDFLR
jgi:hypothetical protein